MVNKIDVAVKGVILYQNKALILKRSNYDGVGAGTWECVGGKINFGEELEHALIRENKEDAGIDVIIDKLLYATSFKPVPSRQVIVITYKCKTDSDKVKLSEEHSEYLWADKKDFGQLLSDTIITDMLKYDAFSKIFDN